MRAVDRPASGDGRSPARPARRRTGQDLALLLLAAIALFSAGIGLRDPWPPDEPRYALVAVEMVETGQWLFPHRNGELYPDKPPVFFWLIAAAYAATGSMRVAFLLPSLLAGLITLALVWDLGRRLWGRRVAAWAGGAALLALQATLQARTAQIDATLTALTTLALYGLLRHLLLGPAWGWWAAAFAAMGLGVITKGVGFLPALVLVPWALARRRRWPGVPRFAWTPGRTLAAPLAMLAVIAAWLVPMLLAAAADPALAAYRDNILLKQTGERYAAAWHHHRWFGYYLLQVVPWAWLPLTLAVPWLAPAWRARLRRRHAPTLLLLGWAALVLLFFSVSPGKRGVYVLPALPAVALAAAPLLPGIARRPGARRAVRVAVAGLGALLVAVAAAVPLVTRAKPDRLEDLGVDPHLLVAPLAVLGAATLALALWPGRRRPLVALAGAVGLAWLLTGWWVYPLLDAGRSPRSFMAALDARLPADVEVGQVAWREQFVLTSPRPLTTFGYARRDLDAETLDAAAWLLAGPDRRLLLPEASLEHCFDPSRAERLGPRHGRVWFLAGPDAVNDQCRATVAGRPVIGWSARR